MPAYRSMTDVAHGLVRTALRPGESTLDGTAGRGGDTLMLAEVVGPNGRVWAVDCQPEAIAETCSRVALAGWSERVTVRRGEHASIEAVFPELTGSSLGVALFNLGYLPGGDKTITTQATSTLHALDFAWKHLRPAGLLVVVCYPGHPEGATEAAAVEDWFRQRADADGVSILKETVGTTRRPAPFVLALRRP